MKKLLTFLGIRKYESIKYYFNRKDERMGYSSKYIQVALDKLIFKNLSCNDRKVIIFATSKARKANWDSGDEKLKNELIKIGLVEGKSFEKIDIKDGENESELWENFEIICNQFEDGDEVYIDITNSLRSIPLIFMAILNYISVVKDNVKIKGIYYGAYELGEKGIDNKIESAPIIDLTMFITLQDWAKATEKFQTTGDSRLLINKLEETSSKVLEENSEIITDVNSALMRYTENILTCRGRNITEDNRKLIESLKLMKNITKEEYSPFTKIVNKVLGNLNGYTGNPIKDEIYAVRQCIDYQLIQQGYTILQEAFLTYLVIMAGKDYKKRNIREDIDKIKKYKKDGTKPKYDMLIDKIGLDKFNNIIRLSDQVKKYRNSLNHSGFTRLEEVDFEEFKDKLECYLYEFEELVNKNELYDEVAMDIQEQRRCLSILSHKLSDIQKQQLKQEWNVDEIEELNEELKFEWGSIDPSSKLDKKLIEKLKNEIEDKTEENDYVIVQGEWGMTFVIVNICFDLDRIPIYATTKRIIKEIKEGQEIKIERIFRHIKFRKYEKVDINKL